MTDLEWRVWLSVIVVLLVALLGVGLRLLNFKARAEYRRRRDEGLLRGALSHLTRPRGEAHGASAGDVQ